MNFREYTQVKTTAGRPLFIHNNMLDLYERVCEKYRTDYHLTTIKRTIVSLQADVLGGKSLNPAADERSLTCGHVTMRYCVLNGSVYVCFLSIGIPQVATKTGLYKVEYDKRENEWLHKKEPILSLDASQQWKSKTETAHYAAVAGRFAGGLKDAAKYMPEHIMGGYRKADFLTDSDKGTEYSLFWSEKGAHKSQGAAEALASVMQQSANNQLPVNWLVHGDGIHTFKNAVRIISTAPLASALEKFKDPLAGKARQQNVFFSNPTSSDSKDNLQALCKKAGMECVDVHTNNRDLHRWSTLKNVGLEMGKMAIKTTSGGAVGVAGMYTTAKSLAGVNGLDRTLMNGISALSSGDYLMAAVCVSGTGLIAMGACKNLRTFRAGISCTFGKGNERWYTDDKALLG